MAKQMENEMEARDYMGVIKWGYLGIMENKVETTIGCRVYGLGFVYWGSMGRSFPECREPNTLMAQKIKTPEPLTK